MFETDKLASVRRTFKRMASDENALDAEGFAQLVELTDALCNALPLAAELLRAEGLSWAELAAPLGITRQAAQQRYRLTGSKLDAAAQSGMVTPAHETAVLRNGVHA